MDPIPRAACSSGRRCPTTSTPPTCWPRRCARTSPSSPAAPPTSTAAAAARCASTSRPRPRTRSARASGGSASVISEQVALYETITGEHRSPGARCPSGRAEGDVVPSERREGGREGRRPEGRQLAGARRLAALRRPGRGRPRRARPRGDRHRRRRRTSSSGLRAERPDVVFIALHGPGRRGRHRPGAARDPRPPLHRARGRRLRALHGQGRRQARDACRRSCRPRTGPPSTRPPSASSAPPTRWRRSSSGSASRWWSSRRARARRSGVEFASSRDEVPEALVAAFSYDDRVLLERYVKGRELAVSVLADRGAAGGRGDSARGGLLQLRGALRDRPHRVRLPGRSGR